MTTIPSHIAAWDAEYRRKGGLWRGSSGFRLDAPQGSHVLEVGCGNGKNASALCTQGFRLVAIDSSSEAIELTRQTVALIGGSCDCRVADVRELPFKASSFDVVICFHVLGHLLEKERAVAAAECSRVLKKGGRLLFKEFGRKDFRCGWYDEVEKHTYQRKTGVLTHYFDKAGVKALFPSLKQEKYWTEDWTVHLRGVAYPRQEVNAVFVKP